MSRSHPAVHPVNLAVIPSHAADIEPDNGIPPPRIRMKDIQGMPGTFTALLLRFLQFSLALVSLAVMITTPDFPSVTAFRYLVAAMSLQTVWSLSLGVVDIYALLVKRSLRNSKVVTLFAMGDGLQTLGSLLFSLTTTRQA
ncbi:hypothetical protein AgCh_003830 [Apium graveolens]